MRERNMPQYLVIDAYLRLKLWYRTRRSKRQGDHGERTVHQLRFLIWTASAIDCGGQQRMPRSKGYLWTKTLWLSVKQNHVYTVESYLYCRIISLLQNHIYTVESYLYCRIISIQQNHIFTVESYLYCRIISILQNHIYTVESYLYCRIISIQQNHIYTVVARFEAELI